MENLVPFLALIGINKKAVDFLKELLPNSLQNKLIQIIAWAVGILTVFIFSESQFADEIVFGKHTLVNADIFTIVVCGLIIGSGAGVVNDLIERRNPDADPDPPD